MSLNHATAIDGILAKLNDAWTANAPAVNGGVLPKLVFEFLEADLKPHPKDTSLAWARAVVRHNDAKKVTLNNSLRNARYRRWGLVWVQVFVPKKDSVAWLTAQNLAAVAQNAYEGKRAGEGNSVVFTKAKIMDKPPEGAFIRVDVQADFYWDEIK